MDSPLEYPWEYYEFIRLYNEGDYYEAHEVLEDLWIMEVPPLKDFYKGLIQAAAAILLWERKRLGGARRMFHSACKILDSYPDKYQGIELREFLLQYRTYFDPLVKSANGSCEMPNRELIPALRIT